MSAKIYGWYLVCINLIFLLSSCDLVTCVEPGMKTNPTEKAQQQFLGEWQWDKTYYGWGGWKTPAQMGYSETISFGANNIYKKFRNGLVVEEAPYRIVKIKSAEPARDSVFVFYLNSQSTGQPLFLINGDTLHTRIFEVCNDCPEEYYIRKKVN
ncbi:hypothetical protein [Adhaeribacter rhizoryzae]|uniref:Uncharacterized protein n=1 Tax=Adhaeribacter rhizoryzae TaxID=2607907 RepID=A0A5M6D911_9BACT|nr:hypothetical protein [Adhaeribacter rhizoryzae]KAA5544017.1 hypothetical protein F0145_15675 [Adhaeribacter rhizoryzae]